MLYSVYHKTLKSRFCQNVHNVVMDVPCHLDDVTKFCKPLVVYNSLNAYRYFTPRHVIV